MYGTYAELSRFNEDFVNMMNRIKTSTEARKESEVVEASENSFAEKRPSRNGVRRLSSVVSTNSSVVIITYIL